MSRAFIPAMTALLCLACATRAGEGPVTPIRGHVTLAAGDHRGATAGNLAVYWLTPTEWDDWQHGRHVLQTAFQVMARMLPLRDVDPAQAPVPFELRPPAGDVYVFAVLDREHAFLPTLFGEGGAGNLLGRQLVHSRGDAVDVPLTDQVPPPREPRCEGTRLRLETVPGPRNTSRHLCVHLPVNYDEVTSNRYPVIYALPGILSTETAGSIGRLSHVVDTMAGAVIVVGVDTSTPWGSTYFDPGALEGDYDTFITHDVVARIDQHYRTLADPSQRALFGQSTGGFNAVSLALRHSDVFQTLLASSPDALDLAPWFLDADQRHVKSKWLDWMRVEDAFGPPGQFISYAADWSPTPQGGFEWPASLTTGEIIPDVWARWQKASPIELLKSESISSAVRARLSNRIYIATSPVDEVGLFVPARLFSEALARAGIEHVFALDDNGHFASERRVHDMVAFGLDAFERARSHQ